MQVIIGTQDYVATLSPLDKGTRGPKRSATLEVIVNGAPAQAKVTSNRAWSGSDGKFLEYIWIQDPASGKFYYITLDYAQLATTFKGAELTIKEGTAKRPNPERIAVGAAKKREQERVKKFKEWAAAN
jgi:hypothetical protein